MRQLCRLLVFAVVLCGSLGPAAPALWSDVLHGIGNIGDGGSSGASTGKYPGMLSTLRGLNFGGPGLSHNAAYSGAGSSSILQPGDAVDVLSAKAQAGDVTLVWMAVGDNDMLDIVPNVADGSLAGPTLDALQAQLVNNLKTAALALKNSGAKVVLGSPSNIANSPAVWPLVASPDAKARVEGAVGEMSAELKDFALQNEIAFIDFYALEKQVFDSGSFVIGGVPISLTTFGPDPHNFFQSSVSAGIAIRAEIANLFLQATNTAYGTNVPLLTDLEILTLAGIGNEYLGETFQQAVPLAQFTFFVPEPASIWLLAVGGSAVLVSGSFGRRLRRCAYVQRDDKKAEFHLTVTR